MNMLSEEQFSTLEFRDMASRGKTIVATIHQPSSQVSNLSIYDLSKDYFLQGYSTAIVFL